MTKVYEALGDMALKENVSSSQVCIQNGIFGHWSLVMLGNYFGKSESHT